MSENLNTVPARFLLSIVLDNGVRVSDDRLSSLMGGLRQLLVPREGVESELIVYDGLAPLVAKSFDSDQILPVSGGRFPLLARAAELALDRLEARKKALFDEGVPLYRPLLFLLTDGFCIDSTDELSARLEAAERAGLLTYLPFCLSEAPLCERVADIDRIKRMPRLLQGGTEGLFAFLSALIERRLAAPIEEGLKFSKSDFEGWAVL